MYALMFAAVMSLVPADAGWLRYNHVADWVPYNHLPDRAGGWSSDTAARPQTGDRYVKRIGVVFKLPAVPMPGDKFVKRIGGLPLRERSRGRTALMAHRLEKKRNSWDSLND